MTDALQVESSSLTVHVQIDGAPQIKPASFSCVAVLALQDQRKLKTSRVNDGADSTNSLQIAVTSVVGPIANQMRFSDYELF